MVVDDISQCTSLHHPASPVKTWPDSTRARRGGALPKDEQMSHAGVEVVNMAEPLKTHVEFRSDRFPAYQNESVDINPGR
jgi:hypothetical protein